MSTFVILVTASAQNTQAHLTALKFADQLLQQKRQLKTVFFYHDAVLVAQETLLPPSDEPQLGERWAKLASDSNLSLQVCVAASLRRGLLGEEEAKEHHLEHANLDSAFEMAGLGQLAAAMSDPSIKLVHFK